jgi:hypothetical protein
MSSTLIYLVSGTLPEDRITEALKKIGVDYQVLFIIVGITSSRAYSAY